MKELEIVFTKTRKKIPIVSWIIRWYLSILKNGWKGIVRLYNYSHCARGFYALGDIKMYYQANEGKVNYENEIPFLSKHEIVKSYKIQVNDEIYKKISRDCLKDAGVKYGLKQNLGIILVDIFELFGKKINNPWKSGKNCSELIYENVFKILFPELSYNKDTIKPHQIEKIILDNFKRNDKDIWELIK